MTGFASISMEDGGQRVNVTAKSVNHRFLDVQVKAPSILGAIEGRLRSQAQQRLARGRVEVTIGLGHGAAGAESRSRVLLGRVVEAIRPRERPRDRQPDRRTRCAFTDSDIRSRSEANTPAVSDGHALVERAVRAMDALVIMRDGRPVLAADLDARIRTLTDPWPISAAAPYGRRPSPAARSGAELPPDLAGDPAMVRRGSVRGDPCR
jgi:hypothetical protein